MHTSPSSQPNHLLKPEAVLLVGEPVGDDPGAFVGPQRDDVLLGLAFGGRHVQDSFPDPGEVAKVEYVVEFCRSGEHLDLERPPKNMQQN